MLFESDVSAEMATGSSVIIRRLPARAALCAAAASPRARVPAPFPRSCLRCCCHAFGASPAHADCALAPTACRMLRVMPPEEARTPAPLRGLRAGRRATVHGLPAAGPACLPSHAAEVGGRRQGVGAAPRRDRRPRPASREAGRPRGRRRRGLARPDGPGRGSRACSDACTYGVVRDVSCEVQAFMTPRTENNRFLSSYESARHILRNGATRVTAAG